MKTTTRQTNELMDILAELYCHATVSTKGMPNKDELSDLTEKAKNFARTLFCKIMDEYEDVFNEKWVIIEDNE